MNQKDLDLIHRIAEEHSNRVFGYLTKEDLVSEIWEICLNAMPEFNKDLGPLEHFLRRTVKNRLINRFKDVTKSVRSPCSRCPHYNKGEKVECGLYRNNKNLCRKWRNYQAAIQSRNTLLNVVGYSTDIAAHKTGIDVVDDSDLAKFLLDNIGDKLRGDLVKLMEGRKITKAKLVQIQQKIKYILKE